MHIIHLNQITVKFPVRTVFDQLQWDIDDHAKVGLVGANGTGKSTLLKVITGEVQPDRGNISRQSNIVVGYLPQDVEFPEGSTLFEEAMRLPERLAQTEAELSAIESQLTQPDVYEDEDRLAHILEQQADVLERYERLNGMRHASVVRELLAMLGFDESDYGLSTKAMSGGQKKLIALVRLAAESPDVLLLDEPDNHLDLAAKGYLERFIRQYSGAVILVSHDRYLLDEVAEQIVELEDGKIEVYKGNYSAYVTERELRRLRQQQLYVAQQKEIDKIKAAIARFELWASMVIDERHIRQARSRQKMLDRMEANGEIIEEVKERRNMKLQLDGWRGSTKVVQLKEIEMSFDDDLLFYDLNWTILHGERIGLVGPNGAGKSVLLKLLLGEYQPTNGIVQIGPSVTVGYYSQEHQTLDEWLDKTPLDLVRNLKLGREGDAVTFLLKMLFTYDQTRQPIRTMSGGERSRLQLATIMLQNPNFLLLDEPTNNLDIPSVEVLEKELDDFQGTVLTISHDRYFLDRVADKIVELRDGILTEFAGGYTDYLDSQKQGQTLAR